MSSTYTELAPPAQAERLATQPAVVKAEVGYTARPKPGETLYRLIGDNAGAETNMERITHVMTVRNLAATPSFHPRLERHGFTVVPLAVPDNVNWDDQQSIKKLYWPVLDQLLKEQLGATRTHIFDSTTRLGHLTDPATQQPAPQAKRTPVGFAHVDYTHVTGAERLRDLLPEEAARLMQTPFAIVQVWRPLAPIDSSPLALMDASTLAEDELLPITLHFPTFTGTSFAVAHHPAHEWWYHRGLTPEQAYMFVCYDSRGGRARFTPHTGLPLLFQCFAAVGAVTFPDITLTSKPSAGFRDPTSSPDAPPRRSVETRCYVFWESLPPAEPVREVDPSHTYNRRNCQLASD